MSCVIFSAQLSKSLIDLAKKVSPLSRHTVKIWALGVSPPRPPRCGECDNSWKRSLNIHTTRIQNRVANGALTNSHFVRVEVGVLLERAGTEPLCELEDILPPGKGKPRNRRLRPGPHGRAAATSLESQPQEGQGSELWHRQVSTCVYTCCPTRAFPCSPRCSTRLRWSRRWGTRCRWRSSAQARAPQEACRVQLSTVRLTYCVFCLK